MTDSDHSPSPERLTDCLKQGTHEEAVACLSRLEAADDDCKRAIRALRDLAEQDAIAFDGLADSLTPFLCGRERAVRLSTIKLFVTLARSEPTAVLPVIEALAARLADDEEFYYVRARAAEALGYLALEHPDAVASPEVVAELTLGLAFDDTEVTQKLAKALEYIALGDPSRLTHHVSKLADHLDAEDELVRYHLCTTLVVVASESPAAVESVTDDLRERLTDDCPHVRGRAAEALGVVATDSDGGLPRERLETLRESEEPFVAARAADALRARGERTVGSGRERQFGTVTSVRESTESARDAIVTPDEDGCPHCGCVLPGAGPPMCPQCGAPR